MPIQIYLLCVELQSLQVFELHLLAVVLESVELDMAWHDKASHSYPLVGWGGAVKYLSRL